MNKFKKWVILKLGGYLPQEINKPKIIYYNLRTTKLKAAIEVSQRDEELLDGKIEEYVKVELAKSLASSMLEQGLIKIYKEPASPLEYPTKDIYTASVLFAEEPYGTV